MAVGLPILRVVLYCTLAVFSLVLIGLTGARLRYTTHLPPGDPLNGGINFHDPIVPELLFTSIMSVLWSFYAIHVILQRREHRLLSTVGGEVLGLGLLFLFWLVGAAVATHIWGRLSFCQHYKACRLLTALVAFSWLGWIVVFALICMSLMFAIANAAWGDPMHGRYDPRASQYAGSPRDSRLSEIREVRHSVP